MELSINTDFIKATGDVEPPLRLIHEAGFENIHWCHHWLGDYIYSNSEIKKIKKLLKTYQLSLFDLHAPHGIIRDWCSGSEFLRKSGESLLLNRIEMTHELGGRAIVLHTNIARLSGRTKRRNLRGIKTLENLEQRCQKLGIKIALENHFKNNGESSFYDLETIFSHFSSDYIGLCWDSGHSNIVTGGIDKIQNFTDRLYVLHLNGNNSMRDEHLPIGRGSVDWDKVARIIAESPYDGVLTQEVSMDANVSPLEYLGDVRDQGSLFAEKVERLRAQ
ncbi:MAG: sugar phosphate isomerase/epimerase [Spirochaetales bacterium]|nr:sugar phosphate isomerase/epimerase [Spirochaetales bacterium]